MIRTDKIRWVLLFLMTFLPSLSFSKAVISWELLEKINKVGESDYLEILVFPKEQPDYENLQRDFITPKRIVEHLREVSRRTQASLLDYLSSETVENVKEFESYWVINAIRVKCKKEIIWNLHKRDDVFYIQEYPNPVLLRETGDYVLPLVPEWNISRVNAPQVWNLGYTGSGVIIGQLDTGVHATHPAFGNRYAGYWYDACSGVPTPYDDNSHGTHTMGTAVGGDGNGPDPNDIGVAPGARFTAAKVFTGSGTACNIISAFQWYASLVADSGVPVKVINNSWGSTSTTDLSFWAVVLVWRSLGIIPVFAIGNSGPGSSTANTPGNYPTVIGVGATDASDIIASFSSRGPAPNMSPWNNTQYWPRPDWNFIKPDISAPGVNIRSSVPGGGYAGGYSWSGTSMAAPHLTGAVAVILQKNPFLNFHQIYQILTESAYRPPQGGSFPNNNYGWGRLDLLQAINMTPTPTLPYIVLVSYSIQSGGDNQLDPGETGSIVVFIANLADSPAINGTLTLGTNSPYITILDSVTNFPIILGRDTVDNSGDPFRVSVSSSAPTGQQITFNLRFVSNNGNYSTELSFSTFIGQPRHHYLDVRSGNALLTVTDRGSLGFMYSDQIQGTGFKYPRTSLNHLYYGSFAVGNAPTYVADAWYEIGGQDDEDFNPTTNPNGMLYYYNPPWGSGEGVWGMYQDNGHPSPRNIRVEMNALGFNDPNNDDFILLIYDITSTQNVNNLYVGLFLDFDIGPGNAYSQNTGATLPSYRMAYMNYSTTYVGALLLQPSTPANLSMIQNQTYIYPYQGMPDSIQWRFLNGTYSFPSGSTPSDWSICVSAGPFNLSPGVPRRVAFALVGGNSLTQLTQHAQRAINFYDSVITFVQEKPIPIVPYEIVEFFYNREKNSLKIVLNLPKDDELRFELYNALGRLVYTKDMSLLRMGTHELEVQLPKVKSGVYFFNLKTSSRLFTRRFLVIN